MQFNVTIKLDDGNTQDVGVIDGYSYIVQNVQPGVTYSIEVVAIENDQKVQLKQRV
ncbi:hypothetical protein ACI2OX_10960 [Bacillus sp. N9]